jgi:DNA modification methylase
MTEHRIIQADVLDGLMILPEGCVQEIVTSPPYYGLRDYGVDGQIGLESSLREYIAKIVEVSRELYRVLRNDGTYLLNLGDCYAGGGKDPTGKNGIGNQTKRQGFHDPRTVIPSGLKAKDLMGVPWRVAFAMQGFAVVPFTSFSVWADELKLARELCDWEAVRIVEEKLRFMDLLSGLIGSGWYLRQDIIWAKPNCMPSSVKDRPTTSHEYIFLLTKKPRYFWDGEAIREPVSESYAKDKRPVGILRQRVNKNTKYPRTGQFKQQKLSGRAAHPPGTRENNLHKKSNAYEDLPRAERRLATGKTGFFHEKDGKTVVPLTRNARSVWVISPQPRPEAHFATFPDELARRCMKAGTSEKGCCPKCGAPYRRIVEVSGGTIGTSWHDHVDDSGVGQRTDTRMATAFQSGAYKREFLGWEPTCRCDAGDPVPCTVLDPFMGSGTVARMARDLGRNSIGIEINAEYIAIARRCLRADEQVPVGNPSVEYRFEKVPG